MKGHNTSFLKSWCFCNQPNFLSNTAPITSPLLNGFTLHFVNWIVNECNAVYRIENAQLYAWGDKKGSQSGLGVELVFFLLPYRYSVLLFNSQIPLCFGTYLLVPVISLLWIRQFCQSSGAVQLTNQKKAFEQCWEAQQTNQNFNFLLKEIFLIFHFKYLHSYKFVLIW